MTTLTNDPKLDPTTSQLSSQEIAWLKGKGAELPKFAQLEVEEEVDNTFGSVSVLTITQKALIAARVSAYLPSKVKADVKKKEAEFEEIKKLLQAKKDVPADKVKAIYQAAKEALRLHDYNKSMWKSLQSHALLALNQYNNHPESKDHLKTREKLKNDFDAAKKKLETEGFDKAQEALEELWFEIDKATAGLNNLHLTPYQHELEKQRLEELKRQKAIMKKAIVVAGGFLDPKIVQLLRLHELRVPVETKVFQPGITWMQNIEDIQDLKVRLDKFKEVCNTVGDARDRQKKLARLLATTKIDETDETAKKALKDVRSFQTTMLLHIPEAFHSELNLESRKKTVEASLSLGPTKRREEILKLLEDSEAKQDETKAFKLAIERGSLKSAVTTDPFVDLPVVPLEPQADQNGKKNQMDTVVYKMNKRALERAYAIRDYGGSVQDVEKAMAHIPARFWPPQLVEDLQAWRRVERAFMEEKVAVAVQNKKLFLAKDVAKPLAVTMADIATILGGAAAGLPDADFAKDVDTPGGKLVRSAAGNIKDLTLGMEPIATGVKKKMDALKREKAASGDDLAEITPEEQKKIVQEVMADLVKKDPHFIKNTVARITGLVSSVNGYAKVAGTESNVLAQMCPILGAVSASIDTAVFFDGFRKTLEAHDVVCKELDEAKQLFAVKGGRDKALVNALINERESLKKQAVQKGIHTVGRGVVAGGAIADASGAAAPAGAVIKAAGKTIEVLNKVVFSQINYAVAQRAMKTIAKAREGDPQARLKVFEHSAQYAKMYIVDLVRREHPLAKKYLVDRGLQEGDLTNPMGLKILREAMLDKAGQASHDKQGGRLRFASDEVLGKGPSLLWDKIAKIKKKNPKTNEAYDGKWKPNPEASLKAEDWSKNKHDAIDNNGLEKEKTGIIDALKNLNSAIDAATDASGSDDTDKQSAAYTKAVQEATNALDVLGGYDPVVTDGRIHAEFAAYVRAIQKEVGNEYKKWREKLVATGALKHDWNAPAADLTAKAWSAAWASAVEACPLIPEEKALKEAKEVRSALATFTKAAASSSRSNKDNAKQRKAHFAARAYLIKVVDALKACRHKCDEFPPLGGYVQSMLEAAVGEAQVINELIKDLPWEDGPEISKDKGKIEITKGFESGTWHAVFKSGQENGFLAKGDDRIGKALKNWEAFLKNVDPDESDEEKKAKTRKKAVRLLSTIADKADDVRDTSPDAPKNLFQYMDWIGDEALRIAQVNYSPPTKK
ncbi:MAG: hypothetical protein ACFCD0_08390 [Gemmataceae bacterium]